jgi:hypothetical protein
MLAQLPTTRILGRFSHVIRAQLARSARGARTIIRDDCGRLAAQQHKQDRQASQAAVGQ